MFCQNSSAKIEHSLWEFDTLLDLKNNSVFRQSNFLTFSSHHIKT